MQRTYDESYLKCSTAVYYESQGDEREAMSCWKGALDQIRQNSSHKKQPNYAPKSETERALLESIRELEVQCQERIDLLEALRISREDDHSFSAGLGATTTRGSSSSPSGSKTPEKGWIGDGTIPAITYKELSKPPLPRRPSYPTRSSSEQAVAGSPSARSDQAPVSISTRPPSLPPYGPSTPKNDTQNDRSPSPDKHSMRKTLRTGKPEKSSRSSRSSAKLTKGPGASKAATLAWSTITSRQPLTRTSSADVSKSSPKIPERRQSSDFAGTSSSPTPLRWDGNRRRLVPTETNTASASRARTEAETPSRLSGDYTPNGPSTLALGAASSAISSLSIQEKPDHNSRLGLNRRGSSPWKNSSKALDGTAITPNPAATSTESLIRRKPVGVPTQTEPNSAKRRSGRERSGSELKSDSTSIDEEPREPKATHRRRKGKQKEDPIPADTRPQSSTESTDEEGEERRGEWERKKKAVLKHLPPGIDAAAAKAIFNEIVVHGDEVRWGDVAGLEVAKNALRETVVYPFLRPDLFMGLREPARGMLLFGPPGTGKTMLARAVATESRSTFFSISASSLTSKYLGESEKLVRALFALAKLMAPSIIFVDEIDSLLSQRSGSGEHEATRRIKTEFLIQWSDLQRAAAGREGPGVAAGGGGSSGGGTTKDKGDPNRVLVLAATNLPWAIDEAARRRFVRRQYIPLPEPETRATQLRTLLSQQKHSLTDADIAELVNMTEGEPSPFTHPDVDQ